MVRIQTSRSAAWRVAATIALLAAAQPACAQLTTHTTEAAWLSSVSAPTLIDFDGLADGTPVTNQYAGLGFSAVNGGNPLAVAYNFSQGGPNVLSLGTPSLTGGGGGVAIDFGAPQQGVGLWYLGSEFAGNSVTVFGAANVVLGTFEMAFPRPAQWAFVGFSSSAFDITRIEVTINPADMVALDSLQFAAAVPEPATAALALEGGLLLGLQRLRRGGPGRSASASAATPAATPRRRRWSHR